MYLISAYFDKCSTMQLSRYINLIADFAGNDFMIRNKVPPHMTICSIEARSHVILENAFVEFSEKLRAGDIRIVALGQFLPYVMYVQPVLNEYLSDLSNEVYKALSDIPETKISKFYSPGSWLPHITIGKTLDKEQMQAAFLKLQNSFTPMQAKITELGLSSVNPHTDIIRKKLKYDLHA